MFQQATLTAQLFGPGTAGTIPQGARLSSISDSQTRVGWVAGAGLEKSSLGKVGELEYLYTTSAQNIFGQTANAVDVSYHDQIVRAGINYQFTAGPVVAKY